eukprot:420281_1
MGIYNTYNTIEPTKTPTHTPAISPTNISLHPNIIATISPSFNPYTSPTIVTINPPAKTTGATNIPSICFAFWTSYKYTHNFTYKIFNIISRKFSIHFTYH